MKLWQGRTEAELDERADAFNRSLPFDRKMLVKDIAGSIAHVSMLRSTEVLEKEDAIAIANALGDMLTEAKEGTLMLDPNAEDVHMAAMSGNGCIRPAPATIRWRLICVCI